MRRDRLVAVIAAAVCFGSVVYAVLWLQGWLGLEPCPLCVLARVAFLAAGAVFVVAAL
ncbi:MAG: disulfide bond formation protein B, partial [Gammaproteobacteria bacterium]|nr:disulfide bond formation protein B [Gammaproteobacteria bacterium]